MQRGTSCIVCVRIVHCGRRLIFFVCSVFAGTVAVKTQNFSVRRRTQIELMHAALERVRHETTGGLARFVVRTMHFRLAEVEQDNRTFGVYAV